MTPAYGKVITTKTYYDSIVTNTHEEMEVQVISSRDELLKDLIDALEPLTKGETPKLDLEIRIDSKGNYRMIRRWVV